MASSVSNQKYDVFLSFRGRDLRKGFVDHLHSSLTTTAKLNVFLDSDEIQPGDDIAYVIKRAIESSSIRIPIFSANYAESVWCLRELTFMCSSPELLIIPLFYDVSPSDVRYPDKGLFAQAFQKHKDRYPESTIAEWKSALFTVSSFSGWSLDMTQRYEGKLVKLVVQDIVNKLNNVPLDVAEFVVGMEERKAEVIKMIGIDSEARLKTVGICGMGGVGKTSLAKAVYNDIYLKFEAACFVSDVRLKSQQINGISQLQGQVLKDLLKVEYQVNDDARGKALIKDRLRYLRCLVILDDVDNLVQLDAIRGDWFAPGSRIIVTTRDSNVLSSKKTDEIYYMKGIPDDQALQLFSWHAFLQTSPDKAFQDLSLMVVQRCGGLPLSLEVLGGFLYDKRDRNLWLEALKQLENAMYDSIHGRLKISYEGLNYNEKEIFLDIACIFIGKETETAITFWEASDLVPNITVTNLVLKSLIRISDDGKFLMHDQLREMGRAIITNESKEPGKRSRLWKLDEVQQVLKSHQEARSVRCLILDGELEVEDAVLDTECLESMQNLQLLWLTGVTITGGLKKLSPQLRWLKMELCTGLDCLGLDSNMEHLAILDLNGSDIKALWRQGSRPKVSKNLKVLNLNRCQHLKEFPDLSYHTSLIALHLNDCMTLSRIPSYFDLLKQLKYLDLSSSEDLQFLHSITKLISLKHLLLSCCYSIKVLPRHLGELKSLETLDLTSTGIQELPDLPSENLKELMLLRCFRLKCLPESIKCLKYLTYLEISECHGLTVLPPSVGELKSLSNLYMKECTRISHLPEEIRNLVNLKELVMNNCCSLMELPQIGSLVNLEHLLLNGCSKLKTLPRDIGDLESLIFLDLGYCSSLTSLPKSIGGLKSLLSLDMQYCISIRKLPEELGNIATLENLNLRQCHNLFELPYLGNLVHLRILNLFNCSCISNLQKKFSGLKALVTLEAGECKFQEGDLTEDIGDLQFLEYLNMEHNTFYTLPASISFLLGLKKLILHHCQNLLEMPILPRGLVKVDVGDCPQLRKVENLSHLEKLEVLVICNCGQLFELPGLGCLKSLKQLNLAGCNSLKGLENIEQLQSLEKLYLNGCPASIINFSCWTKEIPSLQEISLGANKVPKCLKYKMESKMVGQSKAAKYFQISLPTNKCGIRYTGILLCLHLMFKKRVSDFVSDDGSMVLSLIRDEDEIFRHTIFGNRQNSLGDRLFVFIYRENHPFMMNLRDGDRIHIKSTFKSWIVIKNGALQLLYENEVNGERNEYTVLESLSLELNSLLSTQPNVHSHEDDADADADNGPVHHNQSGGEHDTDNKTASNVSTWLKKRSKKLCCISNTI
ncbi:hypothetical protein SUGI_0724280 [Cryptomeria japonica]|nr:hypothetical protein SUGI_0724280 [Cryptomeria japonica]